MKSDSSFVCIILGGGGHARVLIDCLRTGFQNICIHGILDPDHSRWMQTLMGVPILGDDDLLPGLIGRGINSFVIGLGSTGDNLLRQNLFQFGVSHDIQPLTVIHPAAICSHWATIGLGTQLLPLSVVNTDAILGVNVIVNSGAIVEHDCVLGDHVHVATGARLCGEVKVEDGAFIGAGATVKQGVLICERAIIGAGAVVVRDVPAHTTVVGVPARSLRCSKN